MASGQADKNVNQPDDLTNRTPVKAEHRKKTHGNISNAERKKTTEWQLHRTKKRSPKWSS